MGQAEDEFSNGWREANARVRQAELKLEQAWANFAVGSAGPPTQELIEEVIRLRQACDKELTELLRRLGGSGDHKPGAKS